MSFDGPPRVFMPLSDSTLCEPAPLPDEAFVSEPPVGLPREPGNMPSAAFAPEAQESRVFEHGLFRRLLRREPGQPADSPRIARESWSRRPLSVAWFMGAVSGSSVIDEWLREGNGMSGALSLGWDFQDYWGTELRFGLGSPQLRDADRALEARNALIGAPAGWTYAHGRQGDLFQVGINGLVYPWGDSPWRPYFLAGVGATVVSFDDALGNRYNTTMFTMPLGVGMKYHWTDWMALRLEGADNIAFTNGGINTLHNFTVLGAVEVRFGGSHKNYWPWTPSRRSW